MSDTSLCECVSAESVAEAISSGFIELGNRMMMVPTHHASTESCAAMIHRIAISRPLMCDEE